MAETRQTQITDDGVRWARLRKCCNCSFSLHVGGTTTRVCTADPKSPKNIEHGTFLGGPDENCLPGYWRGLVPVDVAAEDAEGRAKRAASLATLFTPFRDRLEPAAFEDALVEAVRAGALTDTEAIDLTERLADGSR